MPGIDLDTLKHALSTARRLGMAHVELEGQGEKFSATLPLDAEDDWDLASENCEESDGGSASGSDPAKKPLTATVVGYFHPLADWHEGASVTGGKVVGEIQALGLANDVTSPLTGTLSALAVQDGDPVEFGQILGWVEESK
jgi:biotin carboxyl carrier protein